MEDKENKRRKKARRKKNFGKKNWQNGKRKTPLFIRDPDEFDEFKNLEDYIILENMEELGGLYHLPNKSEKIETAFGEISILNSPTNPSAFHPESIYAYLELTDEGESTKYNYLKGGLKALIAQHPDDIFFRHVYIQLHLDNIMFDEGYELVKEAVNDFPEVNLFKIVLWYTQAITGKEIENPTVLQEDNIHKIFPKEKNFTTEEVGTFYTLKGQVYINDKNVDMAKQCLDILDEIDFTDDSALLEKKIMFSSYPRWLLRIIPLALLAIVLGIIAFIIWLIVKFFMWIF